ncbi:hypothetical protein [Tenacibaculum ovolyticum]|uniref:hypothetical protein n=1 Tax=Tenacibaculum ovolyticum TaxID=104270 RepID=UPI00041F713D|nr:hypothetical protein [Tenacibaculum ovolyticum]
MAEITLKIAEWKKQYKEVIKITSEEEVAYLKKPTVATVQKFKELKEEDQYKALAFLFKECVLENKEYEDEFMLSASKSLLEKIPQAVESTINKEAGVDEIKKSAALVRHYFNKDPYALPIDEFHQLVGEALWLQEYKNKQLEMTLSNVLVKTFANNSF